MSRIRRSALSSAAPALGSVVKLARRFSSVGLLVLLAACSAASTKAPTDAGRRPDAGGGNAVRDAGRRPDAGGGNATRDAGQDVDAAGHHAATDAATSGSTGTSVCTDNAKCAQPNVCTADYPCQSTAPPDYSCRGLFPEWQNVGAVGPYTASGGVVVDAKSGLHWQQTVDPNSYTWEAAKAYCANLSLSGACWRLPTKSELESIVSFGAYMPAIDGTAFPDTPLSNFWTASPHVISPGHAWCVYFGNGSSYGFPPTDAYRVRCVSTGTK